MSQPPSIPSYFLFSHNAHSDATTTTCHKWLQTLFGYARFQIRSVTHPCAAAPTTLSCKTVCIYASLLPFIQITAEKWIVLEDTSLTPAAAATTGQVISIPFYGGNTTTDHLWSIFAAICDKVDWTPFWKHYKNAFISRATEPPHACKNGIRLFHAADGKYIEGQNLIDPRHF